MNRRRLLVGASASVCGMYAAPLARALPTGSPSRLAAGAVRVRPGDKDWPSVAEWGRLRRQVGGRLARIVSPLESCASEPNGIACNALFHGLKNPYYVGDDPALTQTCGWIDAWTAAPSIYYVAAESAADVGAAVNFARLHNLRLVIRGGGHSYLGTSNAPDSLQIFTRRMNHIVMHDAFVPWGCSGSIDPEPAVSIGAGAIWMHIYNAVTTKGGRIVQGGGCGTVGVAGLVQGGGFGSYSKSFGTAGAGLLEAEVVTADGRVRIANPRCDPDLFWALKGGGAGTFGVVTRVSLRTHDLPATAGVVSLSLRANSDEAYRELVSRFFDFYGQSLFDSHWGETATFRRGNRLELGMEFLGWEEQSVRELWRPFLGWIESKPDIVALAPVVIASAPARSRWDPELFRSRLPGSIQQDDRPGASRDNIFWTANLAEAGHFITGFESLWLSASLLRGEDRPRLVEALFRASRLWSVELHFQKGLAGGSSESLAATKETPMNPAVLDAFCLAIIAGEGPPAFPGLQGHEPDLERARGDARSIEAAMRALKTVVGEVGAYVAESSYFQSQWQTAYWGDHYPRLLDIKKRYDPASLFFVHHGVGSEGWSADGFTRIPT